MTEQPKKLGRPTLKKEPKKSYNVYLVPCEKEALMKKHGSLTAILEKEIKKLQRGKV